MMSSHVFGEMPSDLGPRFARLRATGAEIAKLAVAVNSLAETLPLFDLGARASTDGWRGHILIGMGNPGVVTRILAGRLGNRWTYAGDSVAPGQLSAARLVHEFRVRTIDTATQLFGVVGNPVMHSRSPIMHNAGFAAVGMNAVYLPLEGRDAADVVTFARAMSVQGLSITAPFKIPLMAHVAKVEPLAEQVGAINTIGSRHGAWTGTNTDVEGFLRPLDRRMSLAGTRVCVIGSGGAARAAALGLASRQARVSISARRTEAAHAIAELAGGSVAAFPPAPSTWDVLVNSTPLGSTSTPGDPTAGAALDGRLVYDLVYAPEQTELLARAAASGCEIISGLEMLVAQAERQFEFWTGQQPPAGLFDAASRGMDTSSFATRLTRQTT